ncbi:MAG: hypothetical protein E7588_06815 [Ruminococcaceae bacterium]|nr:hypothetical protein [Oscillospiraceae bacterium]
MKALHYFNKVIRAVGYTTATSFCKKNKQLWVFGAWKGTAYNDNAKYLFEHVTKNEPDIEAIWITKNEEVYNYLKSIGQKVELWPSKKAKYFVRHAGVIFQTEGNRDTGEYRVGRTNIIQLWHGIAIKRLDWYKNYSWLKKNLVRLYADDHTKSIWCSPSDFYSRINHEMMNIPLEQFLMTGCPRNDSFVTKPVNTDFAKEIYNGKNVPVIYLPTHRNFGKDFDANFTLKGLAELEKSFSNYNIMLYYKPHPNEAKMVAAAMREQGISFQNIKMLVGSQYDDLYSYLHLFKCLITDYSSVAYDYLCTGNPIVYFNYDLQQYIDSDAGIVDVYFNHQSGPFCKTWDEVAKKTTELLFTEDIWKDQREICRKIVNPYNDGRNCERVVETIKNML